MQWLCMCGMHNDLNDLKAAKAQLICRQADHTRIALWYKIIKWLSTIYIPITALWFQYRGLNASYLISSCPVLFIWQVHMLTTPRGIAAALFRYDVRTCCFYLYMCTYYSLLVMIHKAVLRISWDAAAPLLWGVLTNVLLPLSCEESLTVSVHANIPKES